MDEDPAHFAVVVQHSGKFQCAAHTAKRAAPLRAVSAGATRGEVPLGATLMPLPASPGALAAANASAAVRSA